MKYPIIIALALTFTACNSIRINPSPAPEHAVSMPSTLKVHIKNNKIERFAKYLNKNCENIYSRDEDGNTLMHLAAEYNRADFIDLLIDAGLGINELNNDKHTPLHIAAFTDKDDCVALLIKRGADISLKDKKGNTPIHLAAFYADDNVWEEISETEFSKDTLNNKGENPLHIACYYANSEAYQVLAKHNKSIEAKDKKGNTPLLAVLASERPSTLAIYRSLIKKGANKTTLNNDGDSILHLAAKRGHHNILEEILSQGTIGINSTNSKGQTPIQIALHNGRFGCFKALLDKGAELDTKDATGRTTLQEIAFWGDLEIAKTLFKKFPEVDLNIQDQKGRTLVHNLAFWGKKQILEFMISKGAKLDMHDQEGETPLHLACMQNKISTAQSLLLHKAPTDAKNSLGNTPLQTAISGYQTSRRLIATLLEYKSPVDHRNIYGETALFDAVRNRRYDLVELLLKNNADVTIKDRNDNSVLDIARKVGDKNIITLLTAIKK